MNFFQSLFAPLYSLNDGVFEEDLVEDTCPIQIRIPLVIKFACTAFDTSDLKANELAFMMALHIVFWYPILMQDGVKAGSQRCHSRST